MIVFFICFLLFTYPCHVYSLFRLVSILYKYFKTWFNNMHFIRSSPHPFFKYKFQLTSMIIMWLATFNTLITQPCGHHNFSHCIGIQPLELFTFFVLIFIKCKFLHSVTDTITPVTVWITLNYGLTNRDCCSTLCCC